MRLDRYLASSGLGSRSQVKDIVRHGRVAVAGQVIRDGGFILPDQNKSPVQVDGQLVATRQNIILMLNKPAGLLTAMEDPRYPTIASLIPDHLKSAGLFPVGRLDRDATGLLLLTRDGTLGHRLASPRWQVWKTYEVAVSGQEFSEQDCALFSRGVSLPDGQVCRPAMLAILTPHLVHLSIHEGKYHQVKKMMQATGRRVIGLRRISVGPLQLDEKLAPGECRELSPQEVAGIYRLVSLEPPV
jgi:16S rRNA pseudouridine516 synthase